MKTLMILRHTEAENSSQDDKLRPLSEKGKESGKHLAKEMKALDICPDHILCSPARRTRETLDSMDETLRDISVIYPDRLYNASTEVLFDTIKTQTDKSASLLVIGHNPAVHDLANRIVGDGREDLINDLKQSYRPGTLSIIECSCDKWSDLEENANTIQHFITREKTELS